MTKQETIEAMAKNVYAAMLFGRTNTPEWVEGGDSIAQDYARTNARAAYAVAHADIRAEIVDEVSAWRDDVLDREEGFDQMMSAMNGTTDE